MATTAGSVLVVDDNELNRILLSTQLEQDGYGVTVAEHGRQALGLLYSQTFDVVLLDLLMPEIDGFQVLSQIKNDPALRRLPVIVISALDEMESVVRCITMGATDHLARPVDPVLLRARVSSSLAAKRLQDQEAEYLRQVSYLTTAAAAVETGNFDPDSLEPVACRSDALGMLARVFQTMAREVESRERFLQQQNRFKSALLGKITHELRSPFVAAGFSVQLLQRYLDCRMIDELHDQIAQLDHQLAQGRKMIDGVITFAALVGKQTPPQCEPTNIAELVQESIAPLALMAKTRKVALSSEIAADLPPVSLDRGQISEAIHHLVHNAIKFNHEGGTVRIACWASNNQLLVRVEDSGCGVTPEKLTTIWQDFAQNADDVQRGIEGLGLGLPLVKYVVDAHRGEVVGRSKPGIGSVFGFRIPIS